VHGTVLPLVVDWDGTATERDTLHMLIERFGDLDVFHAAEEKIGRQLTLHEVIALEMRTVRTALDEAVAWLCEHVRLRRGFAELVAEHDPLVVSAGFHELIEPVLARDGIEARLIANRLDPKPTGWEASFRIAEPCAVCGEPCKRQAVAGLGRFVFVGDGVSDRCVSLAAERVFARAGLARWLDARGVAYEPFEDFVELAGTL
jgi:2-hydroxy-3-keto-5-methylthiopentenyl-1-phosphate phosphatase